MTRPGRIQLSRAKGFRLQAASLALNGLPAKVVARRRGNAGWGNPYQIGHKHRDVPGGDIILVRNRAHAVELHREWLTYHLNGPSADHVRAALAALAGHNLACWCPLDQPCHADVLLELANR